jgi:hypothetical protein
MRLSYEVVWRSTADPTRTHVLPIGKDTDYQL